MSGTRPPSPAPRTSRRPSARRWPPCASTGLADIVPRIAKGPHPFTYWDYRAGAFHKGMGMRIDLVYANAALAGLVKDAWVDRETRKGKGPSDHAPVIVDLDL